MFHHFFVHLVSVLCFNQIFFFGCRLIAICENIYAARAEGELEVEEVLYWTLVKIYRSPHMLLEYTKSDWKGSSWWVPILGRDNRGEKMRTISQYRQAKSWKFWNVMLLNCMQFYYYIYSKLWSHGIMLDFLCWQMSRSLWWITHCQGADIFYDIGMLRWPCSVQL